MIAHRKAPQLSTIIEQWKETYIRQRRWVGEDKRQICERLSALPATATADDIAAVIGNHTWTDITCNECRNATTAAIRFGKEYDAMWICGHCLAQGLELLREES